MTTPGYQSPLGTRYASPIMQNLWGSAHRAELWRQLWLGLVEEERALGIDIPDRALDEMRANLATANLDEVREYEKRLRHDVMAHVHHFGDQAPTARPFLHLGATSAFVTDNAELLVLREALRVVIGRLKVSIEQLAAFADREKNVATVAYTHFQPAQLTTIGKRATLWLQDFVMDANALLHVVDNLPFRGSKGTTGTQASYLELFGGDHEKVKALDTALAARFGFKRTIPVCGQTYTRKIDSQILDALSGLAQSATKFATDMRLLQHEGEVLEPIEQDQIGSSAMAYKRNPMRAERICALGRYVMAQRDNTAYTTATQWFERTLDDSANRRLVLPDSFLATDAILILLANVTKAPEVRAHTVARNVDRVMPFMATERWMMMGVKAGGDRQELHEVVRKASRVVSENMERGEPNDLLDRLANDPSFSALDRDQLQAELEPGLYVGRAPQQVTEYLVSIQSTLKNLEPFADPGESRINV